MTLDPYPVELFAWCTLALHRQDASEVIRRLSSGVGRWRVQIHPPPDTAPGGDPAPVVRVERLDTGASAQRVIPEMAALAEIIDPQRAVPGFLEAVLMLMLELGAPTPATDRP